MFVIYLNETLFYIFVYCFGRHSHNCGAYDQITYCLEPDASELFDSLLDRKTVV